MKVHVTRSYLDMARSVIDTRVHGDPQTAESEDAVFALMSCTYVFSFMALTAFASSHLHSLWKTDDSALRKKYESCASFEELMAGPLKELKVALKELACQLGMPPLHKAKPAAWRELNELLKGYRDYFIHPNPEHFHAHVTATGNLAWSFPSRVATDIITHFFVSTGTETPSWLAQSQLRSRGFDFVRI
ncbi:MAG TPA: hypothetical protein VHA15_02745 [Burkholderiales bacterium]|jgi:hypothetical protein|nr:hypothetical protein [Burkholderiales bacterium]